jgi:hypothetical protein
MSIIFYLIIIFLIITVEKFIAIMVLSIPFHQYFIDMDIASFYILTR